MQEAEKMAKALMSEYQEETLIERQEHIGILKPEINNMLHTYLPDDLTLKEVEILAVLIHQIIVNPRRFLRSQS